MKTITSSREIDTLFKSGKRLFNPYITLIYSTGYPQTYKQSAQDGDADFSASSSLLRPDSEGRVAFIAGKRNGNAVWRNRAKRRMRAICHELGGPWSGIDIIFLAKSRILQDSYSKVMQSCRETLASLGCKVS